MNRHCPHRHSLQGNTAEAQGNLGLCHFGGLIIPVLVSLTVTNEPESDNGAHRSNETRPLSKSGLPRPRDVFLIRLLPIFPGNEYRRPWPEANGIARYLGMSARCTEPVQRITTCKHVIRGSGASPACTSLNRIARKPVYRAGTRRLTAVLEEAAAMT
jgi:hypothetical protein